MLRSSKNITRKISKLKYNINTKKITKILYNKSFTTEYLIKVNNSRNYFPDINNILNNRKS